jgi:hypothetical protein
VRVFLRGQKHHPVFTLIPFQNAEQSAKSRNNHLIYVASRLPLRTASAWRSRGQSFIDLTGSVFLEAPGLLVDKKVERSRSPRQALTKPVDLFADQASNISRYLLKHPPGRSWGVRELASITKVSLGTASKVVRALEERGLVVVTRRGRNASVAMERPSLLFKSWVAAYDLTRNQSLTVRAPVADAKEFVRLLPRKLAAIKAQWALTMQAGAALVAPHATWNQIHLYLNFSSLGMVEKMAAGLNWFPASDGRVTLMLPYYRQSLWKDVRRKDGIPVVDDLQLALDLWNYPGRGREQAENILRRTLPWILDGRD